MSWRFTQQDWDNYFLRCVLRFFWVVFLCLRLPPFGVIELLLVFFSKFSKERPRNIFPRPELRGTLSGELELLFELFPKEKGMGL
jgi:hypothetical protein